MFGWKGYGFAEPATKENFAGKGDVWKLIREWRPFIKYVRTDIISDAKTGEPKFTLDLCKCPKWVGEVINKQLSFKYPNRESAMYNSKTLELKFDDEKK